MIQLEPEDLPKDNPKLEIAVLRPKGPVIKPLRASTTPTMLEFFQNRYTRWEEKKCSLLLRHGGMPLILMNPFIPSYATSSMPLMSLRKSNEELRNDRFETYFQGGLRSDEYFNANQYWLSISSKDELILSRSLEKTIRNPVLRFVTMLAKKIGVLTDEVLNGLSAPIYCRPLDATILRELIGSNERLITEDPAPGVSRVAMPRPPRPTIQDLYDRIVAWRYARVSWRGCPV
ncbi:hypothetical protein Tco_1241095, partial [Tanacetum coccineum]